MEAGVEYAAQVVASGADATLNRSHVDHIGRALCAHASVLKLAVGATELTTAPLHRNISLGTNALTSRKHHISPTTKAITSTV